MPVIGNEFLLPPVFDLAELIHVRPRDAVRPAHAGLILRIPVSGSDGQAEELLFIENVSHLVKIDLI